MTRIVFSVFFLLVIHTAFGQLTAFGRKNYSITYKTTSTKGNIPQPPLFKPKMELVKYTPFDEIEAPAVASVNPAAPAKPAKKQTKTAKSKKKPETAPVVSPRDSNPDAPVEIVATPAPAKGSKAEVAADALYKKQIKTIVDTAYSYLKVTYKSGGTTKAGVDCSGLVMMSYKSIGKNLPRTSAEMSNTGTEIKEIKEIKVGDLVFFDSNNAGKINHVGMITFVSDVDIKFIHATLSAGVIENSLMSNYWKPRHKKTTRVL